MVEHRCGFCKLEFKNLTDVRKHVQNGQKEMTADSKKKCSKCFKSDFLSSCSLKKHEEEECKLNFEPVVILEEIRAKGIVFFRMCEFFI